MTKRQNILNKVATLDFETDPFDYNVIPQPFSVGLTWLHRGKHQYWSYWGDDCVDKLSEFLNTLPPKIIYAHNGGKFDFHFLLKNGLLGQKLLVNNGRIMKAALGKHELRDSYSAIPVPLSAYKKDDIEYWKMKKEHRQSYKKEILKYLKADCDYLHDLVSGFITKFGLKLTIGAAALTELKKRHKFETVSPTTDKIGREFFHGGRVDPIITGVTKGNWQLIDVNSLYPYVMKAFSHPISSRMLPTRPDTSLDWLLTDNLTFFIDLDCTSRRAFPFRTEKGLMFPNGRGRFQITSHELICAMKYNLVDIHKIHRIYYFDKYSSFGNFVDEFINAKIAAKKCGNKAEELFNKLIANNGYGKTTQNPNNFYDWRIITDGNLGNYVNTGWQIYELSAEFTVLKRPSPKQVYHNVCIGASITGAARSVLLDGMMRSENVAYTDTDSIVCSATDLDIHPSNLGAWALEATGDEFCCAGKKMYALFENGNCVKKASKGARLTGTEIKSLCHGVSIHYVNKAPSFSVNKKTSFINRNIQKTC